ncbi:MAG TPA: hypothetical protein VHE37_17535 [Nevskiaceae bacterium]|nr:hypothetical protein [Nevskiaceae bacterium]
MKTKHCLVIAAAAALAACATATPYQPLHDGEGFSEQKIESNRFRVTFAGNSITPRKTVENYLLYRAAELTLESGYDYFIVANRDTQAQTRYTQSFGGGLGFGSYWWGPRSALGVGVSDAVPSTEYEAQADFVMYKGTKPEANVSAFNAREVKTNLEAEIMRPKAPG